MSQSFNYLQHESKRSSDLFLVSGLALVSLTDQAPGAEGLNLTTYYDYVLLVMGQCSILVISF